MNDLTVFKYEENEVRTVLIDGEPWFIAGDVCNVLGIGNTSQALSYLEEDERGVTINDTPGGKQQVSIVNEPGLYSLILRSRKPEAKAFKRWVTHEVLPAIRRTGCYAGQSSSKTKALTRSAQYREAASIIKANIQIAKLLGTDIPMGKAIAVEEARRETGLDFHKLLPLADVQEVPVGIRKIAEIAGLKAKEVSDAIISNGVGCRDDKGNLVLSDLGRELRAGSMEPFKSRSSEHSGYQCKWFPSVIVPMVKSAVAS